MKRRRVANPFGMSFLDVMFCGFGSVVLLVMIVNASAITRRDALHEDLRGEVDRLEREVLTGEKYLVELRATVDELDTSRNQVMRASRDVRTEIGRSMSELERVEDETLARSEHINALQSDLKSLDVQARGLEAELDEDEEKGRQAREFIGAGDRQYLTGLKMGGKRILILVDASASMLDETIVNVLRLRNLPDARKRASKKWQKTLETVEWLVSQLPLDADFQIVAFNVVAKPVPGPGGPGWIATDDAESVEHSIAALREIVPGEGTSLYRAFEAVRALEPRPDNVYLLTDGLPTQGERKPLGNTVNGRQRLGYFEDAVEELPKGISVNTILFPIEGDPFAASAFWKLAMSTGGSLIAPSKDWP